MAGISDQVAMMPENKQLFNDGSELQHEEFSKGILSDSEERDWIGIICLTGIMIHRLAYRSFSVGKFA